MGLYVDDIVFKPYSFNSATLSITRLSTGETVKIRCLNMIKSEKTEIKFDTFEVASGTSIPVFNPSKKGTTVFSLMEGSPETDWLSDTDDGNYEIAWSFSDENAPNMGCSAAMGHIQKHPPVERTNEVPVPEWTLVSGYQITKGGSFALYETA